MDPPSEGCPGGQASATVALGPPWLFAIRTVTMLLGVACMRSGQRHSLFQFPLPVLHGLLAAAAYGFLLAGLAHAFRRMRRAPAARPLSKRLADAFLGECPPADLRTVVDLAWNRFAWQARRLSLRLVLGLAVGLPALVLFLSRGQMANGGTRGVSVALVGEAMAELVLLLMLIPAWLERGVRKELQAGRLDEMLLTAATPAENVGALLLSACLVVLLTGFLGVPVTLMAAAGPGGGLGTVLRIHVLLAAASLAIVAAVLVSAHPGDRLAVREGSDGGIWLFSIWVANVAGSAPAYIQWIPTMNPIYALGEAADGGWGWLAGAALSAFLVARNYRAALREAASGDAALWERGAPMPRPADTPAWAVAHLVRRPQRTAGRLAAYDASNPMWAMERLAGWRIDTGALTVAVWALLMLFLVLLGIGKGAAPSYWSKLIAGNAVLLLAFVGAGTLAALQRELDAGMMGMLALTRLRPGEILGAKLRSGVQRSAWLWVMLLACAGLATLTGGVPAPGGIAGMAMLVVLPPAVSSILLWMALRWQGEALVTGIGALAAPSIPALILAASGSSAGPLLVLLSPVIALYLGLAGRPGSLPLLGLSTVIWLCLGLLAWRLAVRDVRMPG